MKTEAAFGCMQKNAKNQSPILYFLVLLFVHKENFQTIIIIFVSRKMKTSKNQNLNKRAKIRQNAKFYENLKKTTGVLLN